jgi:hypothetical protein
MLAPGPDLALPRHSMETKLGGRNSSSGMDPKQVVRSDMASKKHKKSSHPEQTASQSAARSAKRASPKMAPCVNPTRHRASPLLQCETAKQRKGPLERDIAASVVEGRDCTKVQSPEPPPTMSAVVSPESKRKRRDDTVVSTNLTRLGKEKVLRRTERGTEFDRQSPDCSSSGKHRNKDSRRDKVSRDDKPPQQNNIASWSAPHPEQGETRAPTSLLSNCEKSAHTGMQPTMDTVSSGVVDQEGSNVDQTIQQCSQRPEKRPVFHYSPLQSSRSESRAVQLPEQNRNSVVLQNGSPSDRERKQSASRLADERRKARSNKLYRSLRSDAKRPASSVGNAIQDPPKRARQHAGHSSDGQQSMSQSRTDAKSAQATNANVVTLRQQERQEFVRTDARHGFNAIQALAVDSKDFNRRIDDLCEAFVTRGLHGDWDQYGPMLIREMKRRIEISKEALIEAGSSKSAGRVRKHR